MNPFRIALANLRVPATPEESVMLAEQAIARASIEAADLICFPECFIPGYRCPGKKVPPPDPAFLDRAWSAVAAAAAKAKVGVVLGTERVVCDALLATALVINPDGTIAGFQDKVQTDPSEEAIYSHGSGRQIFQIGPLTFGIVICHEGWRYPETVRWAARRGAQVVFHPHFHEAEPGSYVPSSFGDPANSFHEKAMLCRAAENTCYFASVNCAIAGSPTTSAVVRPDGTLLSYQTYGKEGLLIADIDIAAATGLLAARCKSYEESHAMMKDWALEQLTLLADGGASAHAAWQEAAELVRRAGEYRWVGLYEVTDTEIGAIAWTGTVLPAFPRFPRTKGLNGVAVATKDAVLSQDVSSDPRYLTAFATTGSEGIFPVLGDAGQVIGTIDVESDRRNAFSPEDERFLRACATALRRLWGNVR
jgi:predicted amidohydrolase/putative methionine-R-sulfoxide reductase with GAF domain